MIIVNASKRLRPRWEAVEIGDLWMLPLFIKRKKWTEGHDYEDISSKQTVVHFIVERIHWYDIKNTITYLKLEGTDERYMLHQLYNS